MSLFIDLTFRLLTREASSEQFSAVLPLQLQHDKWEKNNCKRKATIKTYKHHNTYTVLSYWYGTQKHYNDETITLHNIENYVTNGMKKRMQYEKNLIYNINTVVKNKYFTNSLRKYENDPYVYTSL